MRLYHGIDLVNLQDFEEALKHNDNLRERLFTARERNYTNKQLAGNFAGKEALFKAVSGLTSSSFQECEVIRQKTGRPIVVLLGKLREALTGFEVEISISNTKELVIASVVVWN